MVLRYPHTSGFQITIDLPYAHPYKLESKKWGFEPRRGR